MDTKQPLPIPRGEILAGAEDAFFQTMLAGYARDSGGESHVPVLVTQKTEWTRKVVAEVGDFTVIDEWDVNPFTDCSGGRTRILFRGIPVWLMFYIGSYTKEAIPVLKEALARSYRARRFDGGRGLIFHREGDLVYENKVDERSTFTHFGGREVIYRKETLEALGNHTYLGKALI